MAGFQHVHPVWLDATEPGASPSISAAAATTACSPTSHPTGGARPHPRRRPARRRRTTTRSRCPRHADRHGRTATPSPSTATPTPGEPSTLTFSVSRDGKPVTDLQPYLGAYGHLVALRAGDLAYLHVHPTASPATAGHRAGPAITFHADVPERRRLPAVPGLPARRTWSAPPSSPLSVGRRDPRSQAQRTTDGRRRTTSH